MATPTAPTTSTAGRTGRSSHRLRRPGRRPVRGPRLGRHRPRPVGDRRAGSQPPPSPVAASGTTVSASQPVTIDESSATIDVAAKVSPAVVRITASGSVDTSNGVIPETGVGSGVIYDANGWILTNRHVVEGSDDARRSSSTTAAS